MNTLRRLLRRLFLWGFLPILLLLVLAYLLRAPIFESWLRQEIVRSLQAELGGRAAVLGIEGNWITGLELRGLSLQSGTGPLREVRGGKLSIELDPWTLLVDQKLSGLELAKIEATRLVIDLDAPLNSRPPVAEADSSSNAPSWQQLLHAFPRGVSVTVGELQLRGQGKRRNGALSLELLPGTGKRQLRVKGSGLNIRGSIDPATLEARAKLEAEDLSGIAGLFATTPEFRDGKLEAELVATLGRPTLKAKVRLRDLAYASRVVPEGRLDLTIADGLLEVEELSFSLPGLYVTSPALLLPLERQDRSVRDRLAGALRIRINDLSPYREFLPERLRSFLPLRGHVVADIDKGVANVREIRVEGAGVSAVLKKLHMPLQSLFDGEFTPPDCETIDIEVSDSRAIEALLPKELLRLAPLSASVHAKIADGVASVQELQLRGAGLHATCKGAELPVANVLAGESRVPDCDALELEVTGKLPRFDAIPKELMGLVPNRGRLDGHVQDGSFVLKSGVLQGAGLALHLTEGTAKLDGTLHATLTGELRLDAGFRTNTSATGKLEGAGKVSFRLTAKNDRLTSKFGLALQGLSAETVQKALGLSKLSLSGNASVETGMALRDTTVEFRLAASKAKAPRLTLRSDGPIALRAVDANGAYNLDGKILVEQLLPYAEALLGLGPLADSKSTLRLSCSGKLSDPTLDLALDAEVPQPLRRWPSLWDPRLGAAPEDPLLATLRAGGTLSGLELRSLSTTLGAPKSPYLSLRGAGDFPFAISREGRLRPRRAKSPLDFDLEVTPPGSAGIQLSSKLRLGSSTASCESLRIHSANGELSGRFLCKLGDWEVLGGKSPWSQLPIEGAISSPGFSLDALPREWTGIPLLLGRAVSTVKLGGTVGTPEPVAKLSLHGVTLKLSGIPRISALEAEFAIDRKGIRIDRCAGGMGAAPIQASGSYLSTGRPLWLAWDSGKLDVKVSGKNALLARGDGIKVRSDFTLHAVGNTKRIDVSGDVAILSGKYVKRLSLLPSLRTRGGVEVDQRFAPFQIPSKLGRRLYFNVGIATKKPFQVRTNVFDSDLDLELRLRGPASFPQLQGNVAGTRGMLRLPGSFLRVESLLVQFPRRDPSHPRIEMKASGRRYGYRIDLGVSGTLQKPNATFSSTPSLPPEDVLILATTGVLPADLADQKRGAAIVGQYAATELLVYLFGSDSTEEGESWIDRLVIETGQEISSNGVESIRVEYALNRRFFLEVERDQFEFFNGGLGIRWRFK